MVSPCAAGFTDVILFLGSSSLRLLPFAGTRATLSSDQSVLVWFGLSFDAIIGCITRLRNHAEGF